MHLSRRSLFCLPFSLVLNAAEGDSAVILAMRRAYPDLKERRIWHRVRVSNDFDVVLIFAASQLYPSADAGGFWWGNDALLGLFLQPIANPHFVYQIATELGPKGRKPIPLPQPSYSRYIAARPGSVQNGCLRDYTKIEVTIGAWQSFGGTVWLGQSFYDSGASRVLAVLVTSIRQRAVKFSLPPKLSTLR